MVQLTCEFEGIQQKLVVIERKLRLNRGHYHTQIDALKALLPKSEMFIIADEKYDGCVGPVAGAIMPTDYRSAKLVARFRYGSPMEKLTAFGRLMLKGTSYRNQSPYGRYLIDTFSRLGIGPRDCVVIPSADLDAWESSIAVAKALGSSSPRFYLRFLSHHFGEPSKPLRLGRLASVTKRSADNIYLFTETEELASFFQSTFDINMNSNFYLPCSLYFSEIKSREDLNLGIFRVGVFGAPRTEKGSDRVIPIIRAVATLGEVGIEQSHRHQRQAHGQTGR